jgi:hypothetical protein
MATDVVPAAVFAGLFVTGLAGSLHCLAMCGPLLLALSPAVDAGQGPQRGRGRLDFLAYHAGRVWTYALLGAVVGWLGAGARHGSAQLGWQRPLAVGAALLVLVTGLALAGWMPGLRVGRELPGRCLAALRGPSFLGGLARDPRRLARLLLGAVMGLLPCGLVYAALVVAATLPSPVHSALGMVCFGAGTVPALSALLLGGRLAPAWLRARGHKLAGALLVVAGLLMLARIVLVGAGGHGGHGV